MPKLLRVMQVIGSPNAGGAETFYVRLVKAFAKRDFPVEVIPVVRAHSWIAGRLTEAGIPHKTAPFGGWFDNYVTHRTQRILQNYIAAEQPHVVQTWMNRASSMLPITPVPSVGRMGGYYPLKYYANLKHLVGNTEDICSHIKAQGFNPKRVHYVPNFTEEPAPDFVKERAATLKKYAIPANAFVLLVAGRLHENKGVDVAIAALPHLPAHVHLLVAGEGELEAPLRTFAAQHNVAKRVHFTGWTNNISAMAAAADAWLVPSRHEPLGNTILDAWVHNLPVLAANVSGPRSLIEHGGNGLLFAVDDPRALAASVQQLLNTPKLAAQLTKNGAAKYAKTFGREVVLAQYVDLYKHMTRDKKHDNQ
ncbi:MAG: glycosyltransferase [Alphaproteobacteria bacterium]